MLSVLLDRAEHGSGTLSTITQTVTVLLRERTVLSRCSLRLGMPLCGQKTGCVELGYTPE